MSVLKEIWEQIAPTVVQSLIAILLAASAFVVTWLQRQRLKWDTAKQATLEAEELGARMNLGGAAKLAIAVRKTQANAPLLAKMNPVEATRMVHKALRESSPGVPLKDLERDG